MPPLVFGLVSTTWLLHPKTALDRFHLLCDKAGVPRIALHDLRHLTADLATAAGVPLTVASKTLRHRTLSTSANIYTDLTFLAARAAVDAVASVLNDADRAAVDRPRHQTHARTAKYPHTNRHEQKNRPPPGRCGPATTS
ncbi:hypothetical protein AB0O82_24730 [Kitasatospora sp. NPDC088264]|uniref:hypothetical protein n=1 Tax=Kitasatospora sp. NPDC088264 TaxID=3155296 RepID=UPI0034489BEB